MCNSVYLKRKSSATITSLWNELVLYKPSRGSCCERHNIHLEWWRFAQQLNSSPHALHRERRSVLENHRMNTAIKRIKVPKISVRVFWFVAALCIFSSGCSMFYYGHTKEEWMQFSEEEQEEAKKEYQRIVETKREQDDSDTIDTRSQSVIDYGVRKYSP